ncbi:MAG: hypothetical protein HY720_16890 [Planctomycetes bacterium]|nr:hypothetical protein [Planctomycetota bacterium]
MKKGSALIVVVGVLAVLCLMALAFARFNSLERDGARSYRHRLTASLAAEAGIEEAIARLRSGEGRRPWTSMGDPWIYRGNDVKPLSPGHGVPLTSALYPSFALDEPLRGYVVSGVVPPSPGGAEAEDLAAGYKIRVFDTQGQINLNDPHPRLDKILDSLGKMIEVDTGQPDPVVGARYTDAAGKRWKGGAAIVKYRDAQPGGLIQDKADIAGVLGQTAAGMDAYRNLADYVTVRSWANEKVIVPQPRNQRSATFAVELAVRHPVDVNTASYPVLVSLLNGLRGFRHVVAPGGIVPVASPGKPPLYQPVLYRKQRTAAISFDQARAIGAAILVCRGIAPGEGASYEGPYTTWSQFDAFVDALPGEIATNRRAELAAIYPDAVARLEALTPGQLDVLKSNANPNSWLNRYHPDAARYRTVDKGDLDTWSMEFCFSSMGYYEITSEGLVLDREGGLLARHAVRVEARLFDCLHLTHQADLEDFRESLPAEGTETFPESMADYGVPSQADGYVQLHSRPGKVHQFSGRPATFASSFTDKLNEDKTKIYAAHYDAKEEGESVHAGSDLLVDGLRSNMYVPRCSAWQNVDSILKRDKGTIEFWIKMDRDAVIPGEAVAPEFLTDPVLHWHHEGIPGRNGKMSRGHVATWLAIHGTTEDDPEGAKLHLRRIYSESLARYVEADEDAREGTYGIRAGMDEGMFGSGVSNDDENGTDFGTEEDGERPGYATPPNEVNQAISPFDLSLTMIDAPIDWKAGTWHHVALTWTRSMDARLYVDGVEATDATQLDWDEYFLTRPFAGMTYLFLGDWAILGARRQLNQLDTGTKWEWSGNFTIDDFKAYDLVEYNADFSPPTRFSHNPAKPGAYFARVRFQSGAKGYNPARATRILSVAWTAILPPNWPGRVEVSLDARDGDGWIDYSQASPLGEGARVDRSVNTAGWLAWRVEFPIDPTALPVSKPLYDSAVLDDLTFFLALPSVEILSWTENSD